MAQCAPGERLKALHALPRCFALDPSVELPMRHCIALVHGFRCQYQWRERTRVKNLSPVHQLDIKVARDCGERLRYPSHLCEGLLLFACVPRGACHTCP